MHLICTGMSFKLACVPKNMLNRSIEESAAQLDALSRMGMMVCSPGTETPSLARCLYLFSAPPPGLLHFGQGWHYSAAALHAELDALDLANMDIVDVAKVKDVCSKHGTTLAVDSSSRERSLPDGKPGRLVSYVLKCKHDMKNRQAADVTASGERSTCFKYLFQAL